MLSREHVLHTHSHTHTQVLRDKERAFKYMENTFYLENTFYIRIPACPPSALRHKRTPRERARERAHARGLGEERKRRNPTVEAARFRV
jgi:hypothetical protein